MPLTTVPLISEREEHERSVSRSRGMSREGARRQSSADGEIEVHTPALSSAWSSKTLAALSDDHGHGHEKEKDLDPESRRPSMVVDGEEVEATYPDGGYGWVVLCACISLAGLTMGWVG